MIDLETLGTDSNCVVVSIGACFFDLGTKTLGHTFHMILDVQDQLDRGRKVSADTLKWWIGQSDAAKTIFSDKAQSPLSILGLFNQWIKMNSDKRKLKVWGNGATFDISILESMFDVYRVERPWTYSGVMDLRTFRRFVANNAKVENTGTKHSALDDAISQANFVMRYYEPKANMGS